MVMVMVMVVIMFVVMIMFVMGIVVRVGLRFAPVRQSIQQAISTMTIPETS